jgi:hypothetical protein
MEPEGLLLYSQESATGPNLGLDKIQSTSSHPISKRKKKERKKDEITHA